MKPADLWTRVKRGSAAACWPWPRARSSDGYGSVKIDGRSVGTHRLAWELTFGMIPERLQVLHHCDNPPCCNPAHLFLGTPLLNALDCKQKDRNRPMRGSQNGRAKLTVKQVKEIKMRKSAGESFLSLARAFGVGHSAVERVVYRQSWAHLAEEDVG